MRLASGEVERVLRLERVGVRRDGRWILDDVDWTVHRGQRWVVVGPNGAGKTTLASIVATYLWPTRGTIEVLGAQIGRVDARELRRRIGLVSAALAARLEDRLTAFDAVVAARDAALAPWWSSFDDDDRALALAALTRMGCRHLAERTMGSLSSGERQRVQIARTLMADPDLLVLDEPAAGLDLGAREELVERIEGLADAPSPAAIVLVTHHLEEIPSGMTHALILAAGRVVAAGPLETTITSDFLSAAYGTPLRVERSDGRFHARRAAGSADGPAGVTSGGREAE
ncbi:MAG: ATP-binding cassette domain-containing protein [Chloroflexi bacterium]|nr:ATP-binding cassette domain-containing protein [Chloroflexota bacterium]